MPKQQAGQIWNPGCISKVTDDEADGVMVLDHYYANSTAGLNQFSMIGEAFSVRGPNACSLTILPYATR